MINILDNQEERDRQEASPARRLAAAAIKKEGGPGGAAARLVAAGYGKLAEDILRLAFDNGVKVREDRALAEMLAAIEADCDIPSEALVAIAEILAYIYKLNAEADA